MGRLSKIKRELIREANRKLLGEQVTREEWIVKNIWEPNTPPGYGMGENGKALVDYFEEKLDGQWQSGTPYLWVCSPHHNMPQTFCSEKYALEADGEYVTIYRCTGESPKIIEYSKADCSSVEEIGSWGGDSWGGEGFDQEDIQEMFAAMNLSWHLDESPD